MPAMALMALPVMVAPPGPEAMVKVTFDVLPVTMLPNASSTSMTSDGLTALPAVAVDGAGAKTSLDAAAALTVKLADVADASVPSVAFSVYLAALSRIRLEKVATPALAATETV